MIFNILFMKRVGKILFLTVFLVFFLFLTENIVLRAEESDAISVRVLPNPKHFSSLRWYQEQGFIGTPQSLLVDGYEAVRNGNTVYVDAANTDDGDPPSFYTNIYIISYNIESDRSTENIFSQILDNWRFNSNINYIVGSCVDEPAIDCVYDLDCQENDYCDSPKAEIIRNTTRYANIAELEIAITKYKEKEGVYPVFPAGSYLSNKSVSAWSSWVGVFSEILGKELPRDPVDRLPECPGFNPETCWDEETRTFAFLNEDNQIELPEDAHVLTYEVSRDGSTYALCGFLEGEYDFPTISDACAGTSVVGGGGEISNGPPSILGYDIPVALSGHPYEAYIQATDPENDFISWDIDVSFSDWLGNSWEEEPYIVTTDANNNIKIESSGVGVPGTYSFRLTLDDGNGNIITADFSIEAINFPPEILGTNVSFIASSTDTFYYSFRVRGDTFNYPLSLVISDLPDSFTSSFNLVGEEYEVVIEGPLDTWDDPNGNLIPDIGIGATVWSYSIEVEDNIGAQNTRNLSISLINHRPELTVPGSCDAEVRVSYTDCVPDWGGVVTEGSTVDAFSVQSVPCGESCDDYREDRVCSDAVLSGSFPFGSCIEEPCTASCDYPLGGGSVLHTNSQTFYSKRNAYCDEPLDTCADNSITRICTNGDLSGDASYVYTSCDDNVCPGILTCNTGADVCEEIIIPLFKYGTERTVTTFPFSTETSFLSGCGDEYLPIACEWMNHDVSIFDWYNNIEIWGGVVPGLQSGSCVLDDSASDNEGYYLEMNNYSSRDYSVRSLCVARSLVRKGPSIFLPSSMGNMEGVYSPLGSISGCSAGFSPVSIEWSDNNTTWRNTSEMEGLYMASSSMAVFERNGTGYQAKTSIVNSLWYRTLCVNDLIYQEAPSINHTGTLGATTTSASISSCGLGFIPVSCEWRLSTTDPWIGNKELVGGSLGGDNVAISCELRAGENGYRLSSDNFDQIVYMHSICVEEN